MKEASKVIWELPYFDSREGVRFDDLNSLVEKLNELIKDYNKRIGEENAT